MSFHGDPLRRPSWPGGPRAAGAGCPADWGKATGRPSRHWRRRPPHGHRHRPARRPPTPNWRSDRHRVMAEAIVTVIRSQQRHSRVTVKEPDQVTDPMSEHNAALSVRCILRIKKSGERCRVRILVPLRFEAGVLIVCVHFGGAGGACLTVGSRLTVGSSSGGVSAGTAPGRRPAP